MAKIVEELALALPGLSKAVFSQPVDRLTYTKVMLRPVRIKGGISYQVEIFDKNKGICVAGNEGK